MITAGATSLRRALNETETETVFVCVCVCVFVILVVRIHFYCHDGVFALLDMSRGVYDCHCSNTIQFSQGDERDVYVKKQLHRFISTSASHSVAWHGG